MFKKGGDILVFLPGVGEINQMMKNCHRVIDCDNIDLLSLHAGLTSDEQKLCFQKSRHGKRKVILSTNVAETSVTLPEVTVVIDCCRARVTGFDESSGCRALTEQYCAQDSLKQRTGRAGRVQPGVCFRMVSESQFSKFPVGTLPEFKRIPVDGILLQVMAFGHKAETFLTQVPDPPSRDAIVLAQQNLLALCAITIEPGGAELTAIGRHLAMLPTHPRLGKLLLVGSMLGCASAALSIAAFLAARAPMKFTRDDDVLAARLQLAKSLGSRSDHALSVMLMNSWDSGKNKERQNMCDVYGLSFPRMQEAHQEWKHLARALESIGFLPIGFNEGKCRGCDEDMYSTDWRVVKSVITAAFCCNLVKVERPATKYISTQAGAVAKDADSTQMRFFISRPKSDIAELEAARESPAIVREDDEIADVGFQMGEDGAREWMFSVIDKNSVCRDESKYNCPWLVYHAKDKVVRPGCKPFIAIRDVTEVNVYSLLLFGRNLELASDIDDQKALVTIDKWARFSGGSARVVALLRALRHALDAILWEKVQNPNIKLGDFMEVEAMFKLLLTDGLGA
jgi:ATP-dependent RNA helicase DHX57